MTNLTPAQTDALGTALNTAALLAVIELLVAPEFDDDFIKETCEDAGVEPTDENIETVINTLNEKNQALALPLIAQLPYELRERYLKR
jgi:ribosomal protein L12E/L44/L45/RPP1/RPP2